MKSTVDQTASALYRDVQSVLDETLSLGQRAYELQPDSPLLGALPELDSQAVLNVLMGLEEKFGITIEDDDVSGDVFATFGSLADLVARKATGA